MSIFTVTFDQFKATVCKKFFLLYVSLVSGNEVERNERIALWQETNAHVQISTVFTIVILHSLQNR